MTNYVSEAVGLFRNGCACSQAILAVYGPRYGIERDLAMRVASGFAGGMRMAERCGAVTGAFMVLGLHHAAAGCEIREGREKTYAAVNDFTCRFRKRNKSVVCRELLGCDITTPEGKQTVDEQDLLSTLCPKLVQDAAELLGEMIKES